MKNPKVINELDSQHTSVEGDVASRGMISPNIQFYDVIEIVRIIHNDVGHHGFIDAIATSIHTSRTSSKMRHILSILKRMRLIQVKGDRYTLSDSALVIATSENQDSIRSILHSTLMYLPPISYLMTKYTGLEIPKMETIAPRLAGDMNMPLHVAGKWVEYFIRAGVYVGFIRRDGGTWIVANKTQFSKQSSRTESRALVQQDDIATNSKVISVSNVSDNLTAIVKSRLEKMKSEENNLMEAPSVSGVLHRRGLSGNRQIVISHPDELTPEDVEAIKKILKVAEVGLDAYLKQ